jgi:hypothetical protein
VEVGGDVDLGGEGRGGAEVLVEREEELDPRRRHGGAGPHGGGVGRYSLLSAPVHLLPGRPLAVRRRLQSQPRRAPTGHHGPPLGCLLHG